MLILLLLLTYCITIYPHIYYVIILFMYRRVIVVIVCIRLP